MAYFVFGFVLVIYILTAFLPTTTSKCEKVLSMCKVSDLPISSDKKGPTGEKGIRGDAGLPGIGAKGEPGDEGSKGVIGVTEEPLSISRPYIASTSESPTAGINTGSTGEAGPKGNPGKSGDKGDIGPRGPVGEQGVNGICPCPIDTTGFPLADPSLPIKDVCKITQQKFGNDIIQLNTTYYGSIKVVCKTRKGLSTLTCLPPISSLDSSKTLKIFTFTNISEGFWLSPNFTLEEIYGINKNQLYWLQNNSNSAFQTLRYHCLNSVPYSPIEPEKSLLLLSLKDKTIGPVAQLNKNFNYHLEYDGCSETTDTWSYTDIKIIPRAHRQLAPVIDFYIRDIGNELTQKFKIEHVQLCFD